MIVSRRCIFVLVAVGLFVFPSASGTFDAPVSDWNRMEVPTENMSYRPSGVGIDVRDGLKAVAIQTLDTTDPPFKGRNLYVTTSRGDDAWSEPVEIAGSDHDIRPSPLIRIDGQGSLHVLWQEQDRFEEGIADDTDWIRYAMYDGQEWTEPITLFKRRGHSFQSPSTLLIDENDRLHFSVSAYTEAGQAARNYYISGRGDDWTVAEVDDGTTDPGPPDIALASSLAMSASGALNLVFTAGSRESANDLYHTYSLDGGATWASARRIYKSGARFAYGPTLQAGPGDALHLTWTEAPTRGALPDEAYHAYLSEDRLLSEKARGAGSASALRCQTSQMAADTTARYVSDPSLSVTSSGYAFAFLTSIRNLSSGEGAAYSAYWDGQWRDFTPLEDAPGGDKTATTYRDGVMYAVYTRLESPDGEEEREYDVELARQPVPFDQSAEMPECPGLFTDSETGSITPYPNPTSGSLSLEVCPPEDAGGIKLQFYNALGQRVRTSHQWPIDDARCTTVQNLDVGNLASGVYFVDAVAEGKVFDTSSVVVVR